MIRLIDAVTLAHTKLRTHKIRTGITIGTAGILFGLILACIFIVQGVLDSVNRFGEEGLNGRALLTISRSDTSFNVYDKLGDSEFIAKVETRHAEVIAKKQASAKKYNVPYDAAVEDTSPITIDPKTKAKSIEPSDMRHETVTDVASGYREKEYKPFDIEGYLTPYKTARILPNNSRIQGADGASFTYMKDGKEQSLVSLQQQLQSQSQDPKLSIVNQSIADPFIEKNSTYDPTSGEIPVILPFEQAEKALGLKKLEGTATTKDKYDRLQTVKSRLGEITAAFCYRNIASQQLVSMAQSQREDMSKNERDSQYRAPALVYKAIDPTACGAVEVEKDTRTLAEKQQADRFVQYQKEIGEYVGEPQQFKVTVRAVGLSGATPGGASVSTVSDTVQSLLASWLGYGEWVIPVGLLREVPEKYRPADLFIIEETMKLEKIGDLMGFESYLVEFDDPQEARAAMKRSGYGAAGQSEISAYPYGSGMLVIEDFKDMFAKVVWWAMIIIGGVAIIILGSMIGRTVSEGRRESAVFRAIGARRSDIGAIYGMYTLLLSLRVVLFAVILGAAVALTVELLFWEETTLGARFAYAAVDTTKEFHLFSVTSPYVAVVLGGIVIVGMVASIIPIIRSARRNPIKDMRDDT